MDKDIRWKQRFQNYKKALVTMKNAVELSNERELTDLEKQGVIQGFEFTLELAWNVMKDYLEEQGIVDIDGSKSAVRHAFKSGLVEDGETWMNIISSRNISSHTYNEEIAEKLFSMIIGVFYDQFVSFQNKMTSLE